MAAAGVTGTRRCSITADSEGCSRRSRREATARSGLAQGLLQAGEVGGDELGPSRRIGCLQHPSDVDERHVEIPEPSDHLSDRDLDVAVSAIAGDRIDLRGFEEAGLVVVAQGLDAEEGDPREVADRQRARHVPSFDPPLGESQPGRNPLTLP